MSRQAGQQGHLEAAHLTRDSQLMQLLCWGSRSSQKRKLKFGIWYRGRVSERVELHSGVRCGLAASRQMMKEKEDGNGDWHRSWAVAAKSKQTCIASASAFH